MNQVDRLIVKALKNRPEYGDIFIISNASGVWMVDDIPFATLEAAEEYIDGLTAGLEGFLEIINDAGPGIERSVSGCGNNQVKNTIAYRSTPDAYPSHEHGGKRPDGHKNGEYNHSWV